MSITNTKPHDGDFWATPKEVKEALSELIKNKNITAKDVALMMVLFKIARLGHNYTRDSVVDICGYTAIYATMHGD